MITKKFLLIFITLNFGASNQRSETNLNQLAIIYIFLYPIEETLIKIVNDLLCNKIISRNTLKICKDLTQNISWIDLLANSFDIH